jgi:predicted negative regulator of RcsB-dependent stress response
MSEQERFLIRLLAVGMAVVVIIVLTVIGFVAWKTFRQMQEDAEKETS